MPVYFRRVYDSRSRGNADFGDGWRLALGEALLKGEDEGGLTYIDGAGARHDFRRDATAGPDVFVASPGTPSHNANRLWARGDEALLEHEDGTKRRFTWSYRKNRYLLTEVSMAGGQRMTLDYKDGSVVRVLLDGTVALSVARGGSGRVESVTGRFGRSVQYSYTGDGQLKDVYDVAGRLWYHRYEGRRLAAVVGPTREDYLVADYDKEGRVVRTKGARIRTYVCTLRRTVVREGAGRVDEFDQNADGITYAYNSTSGVKWRLSFDAKNRAEAITTPAGTTSYVYDAEGRIERLNESSGGEATERTMSYDGLGRLQSESDSRAGTSRITYGEAATEIDDGVFKFGFTQSENGHVLRVDIPPVNVAISYEDGLVSAFHSGTESVRFRRDAMGRIVGTTYPDGGTRTYAYDALGNRTITRHSLDEAERYTYDGAGNLTEVVVESQGTRSKQTYRIGAMNRVERITGPDPGSMDIEYDALGNPVRFSTTEDVVAVEYTATGRISNIRSEVSGNSWVPDGVFSATDELSRIHDTTEAKRVVLAGMRPSIFNPTTAP